MKQRGLLILAVFLLLCTIVVLLILPIMTWEICSNNLGSWMVISGFSGGLILFKVWLLWLILRSHRRTKNKR